MKAENKGSILITGAARRIGAELAKALARDGWYICVHYNASRREAEALLAEIVDAGGAGKLIDADLSQADAASTLVERSMIAAPPLVALINNASVFEYDDIGSLTASALDRHYAVNLRAPVLLSKAFLEATGVEGEGCIINMLDNKVFAVNPDYLSYTVSKFGLHGATLALAMALAPRVRVNAIAPGITLESGGQGEQSFEKGLAMSPLGRVSSTRDIVQAARFILTTPSLNGQVIAIDGGQHLQKLPRDVAFLESTRD
jgi:NAD(P)-dependent dehydrogenase (short-subunit alcohol dehydrogenase family)